VGRNRSAVGYRSNELGAVGDGGFADAPVDLTITSKAKIKNSNAAIHHIISYQRILCCAVVFAGRVFDLLYDTMMMGVRCDGTTLFEIRVALSEFNWRGSIAELRAKGPSS
jgi:hypothetical protein